MQHLAGQRRRLHAERGSLGGEDELHVVPVLAGGLPDAALAGEVQHGLLALDELDQLRAVVGPPAGAGHDVIDLDGIVSGGGGPDLDDDLGGGDVADLRGDGHALAQAQDEQLLLADLELELDPLLADALLLVGDLLELHAPGVGVGLAVADVDPDVGDGDVGDRLEALLLAAQLLVAGVLDLELAQLLLELLLERAALLRLVLAEHQARALDPDVVDALARRVGRLLAGLDDGGDQGLVGEHGRDPGDPQAGHAAQQLDDAAADHVGAVLEHGDLDDGGLEVEDRRAQAGQVLGGFVDDRGLGHGHCSRRLPPMSSFLAEILIT